MAAAPGPRLLIGLSMITQSTDLSALFCTVTNTILAIQKRREREIHETRLFKNRTTHTRKFDVCLIIEELAGTNKHFTIY